MRAMLIEKVLAYVLYFSGVYFLFRKIKGAGQVRILTYHRVLDSRSPESPGMVTREAFGRQMEYLSREYSPISLERFLEGIRKGGLKKNSVVVTLDDGYRDNYTNAYPVLKRYGIPATVFLTTGLIGTGDLPWFDRVSLMVSLSEKNEIRLLGRRFGISSEKQKRAAVQEILSLMKGMDNERRMESIRRLQRDLGIEDRSLPRGRMLEWGDVSEMSEEGLVSFGSHTVTHPILSRLSPRDLKREVLSSKRMIEENIRRDVDMFSYPNGDRGDFNDEIKGLVREHYSCAVSTIPGFNGMGSDLFELRRIGCSHENDDIVFRVKVSGILNSFVEAYRKIRGGG